MEGLGALVSIIIPCYNREKFLVGALESVLRQSYLNWECIVVDDQSTDRTKEVVIKYSNQDPRIIYAINRRTKGAQGARNTGILNAKGDFVAFLDSDDELTIDSIKCRLEYFRLKRKDEALVGLVYGDMLNFSFHRADGFSRQFLIKNLCLCPFSVIMVPRSIFLQEGLLDEKFPAWQDDDFLVSISSKYHIYHSREIVASWNVGPKDDSISVNQTKVELGLRLLLSKHRDSILREAGVFCLFLWKVRLSMLRIQNQASGRTQRAFARARQRFNKMLLFYFDIIYV